MQAPEKNSKIYKLFNKGSAATLFRSRLSNEYGIHPRNFKDEYEEDNIKLQMKALMKQETIDNAVHQFFSKHQLTYHERGLQEKDLQEHCEATLDQFRMRLSVKNLSEDRKSQLFQNMNFVKKMIIQEVRKNFQEKRYTTASKNDKRTIRWVFQYDSLGNSTNSKSLFDETSVTGCW